MRSKNMLGTVTPSPGGQPKCSPLFCSNTNTHTLHARTDDQNQVTRPQRNSPLTSDLLSSLQVILRFSHVARPKEPSTPANMCLGGFAPWSMALTMNSDNRTLSNGEVKHPLPSKRTRLTALVDLHSMANISQQHSSRTTVVR